MIEVMISAAHIKFPYKRIFIAICNVMLCMSCHAKPREATEIKSKCQTELFAPVISFLFSARARVRAHARARQLVFWRMPYSVAQTPQRPRSLRHHSHHRPPRCCFDCLGFEGLHLLLSSCPSSGRLNWLRRCTASLRN